MAAAVEEAVEAAAEEAVAEEEAVEAVEAGVAREEPARPRGERAKGVPQVGVGPGLHCRAARTLTDQRT